VFQTGRKVVGRAFVLYVARREGQGRRFGCAVSRRVGKAVVRNRVKRRLREFHRTHRHLLPEDAWLVAVARPAAAELTHDQCRATLTELYERGNRAWAESR
jgi:ribonuclease P protein component